MYEVLILTTLVLVVMKHWWVDGLCWAWVFAPMYVALVTHAVSKVMKLSDG